MTDTTTTNTSTPPPVAEPVAPEHASATNPFRDSTASTTAVAGAPAAQSAPTPPPDAAAPPQPQQRESPVDPRVVALRAMFPDYDDLVLQSVLESVGGDQDRAIDALLAMSDPDYRAEPTPAQPVLSQTDLDEQLARRLMIEEQEQHQSAWQAQHDARRPQNLPPRPNQQQPQSAGAGGGDTMAEFQQQFNKVAEAGKKTFGTIFSKVKAKIQEMDQPKMGSGSNWGGTPGYDPGHYEQQHSQAQPPQPAYPTRPSQAQAQPAYYDPNAQTSYPLHTSSPPITLGPAPVANVQGYDTTPEPAAHSTPPLSGAATTPPVTDAPRPPQTGSGLGSQSTPIDGGKLGILPKRPVSLLRSQSPPQARRQESQDESDGLDYAENPFEEPKK